MLYPDLMLTKAVALRRTERRQRAIDQHMPFTYARVYRSRLQPPWLHRLQFAIAGQLVEWGEKLQAYNAVPVALARKPSSNEDCFETIK